MTYLDPMLVVPDWLGTIVRSVDELVESTGGMDHWRGKLRDWEHDLDKQKDEPTALPLPPPARALTLPEKYAALAAIHDVTCDAERARIDRWDIRALLGKDSDEKAPRPYVRGAASYADICGNARDMQDESQECAQRGEVYGHRVTLEKWLGEIELEMNKGVPPEAGTPTRLPMTDGQKRLWDALAGTAMAAKELAAPDKLDTSEETVRQWVAELRKAGYVIAHRSRRGYFRPDSPPDDTTSSQPTA